MVLVYGMIMGMCGKINARCSRFDYCLSTISHSSVRFLHPDVIQHCQRVKPIIDLVHKVISTDVSIADCLLPITSRIYMLLQR